MIKRILALMLALCLLLPGAGLAQEESVDLSMPESLQCWGDTLWALTYQGVHRLDGDWRTVLPTDWSQENPVHYQRLWVNEAGAYLLGQLTDESGAARFVIDRADHGEDGLLLPAQRLCEIQWSLGSESWVNFAGFVVEGESALVLYHNDTSGAQWGQNTLCRVSLADGAAQDIAQDYFSALQPWKDGLYIASLWNQSEAYQQNPPTLPAIVSVNADTGEATHLADMPSVDCGGLVYDAAEDAVYFCDSSTLYRYDNSFASPQRVGYLLPSDSGRGDMAAAVCGGRYYIADWQSGAELASCLIDPEALPKTTLRLTRSWAVSDLVRDFAAEHPEIAVEYAASSPYGAEEVRQHMQSEDAADLYAISTGDAHFIPLRDKGYLADLSAAQAVTALVEGMYPHMTREMYREGKLCALPVGISASTLGYYPAALEKVGLTEADLPSSIEGMLEFIERWYYDFHADWEDMRLFEFTWNLREQLFQQIFSTHLLSTAGQASPDMTDVRRLLAKLEELTPILEELAPVPEESADGIVAYFGDYSQDSALFTDYADPLPRAYSSWDGAPQPMPLALCEGDAPQVWATLSLLTLNPYSDNADAALLLLDYIAQRLPQEYLTAVKPDANDPIELSYYQDNLTSITQSLEHYRDALATAAEAERVHLEEIVDMLEAELTVMEADRWAFSAEDIAAYRTLAPHIEVAPASIFAVDATEVSTLMQRYLDRQISLDQFVREFERIWRMMILEGG